MAEYENFDLTVYTQGFTNAQSTDEWAKFGLTARSTQYNGSRTSEALQRNLLSSFQIISVLVLSFICLEFAFGKNIYLCEKLLGMIFFS